MQLSEILKFPVHKVTAFTFGTPCGESCYCDTRMYIYIANTAVKVLNKANDYWVLIIRQPTQAVHALSVAPDGHQVANRITYRRSLFGS